MHLTTILSRFILVASILLVSFSGCKKYEEDDYWFTLRTPKNRVWGKHIISEFTVNGLDSLTYFKNRYGEFYFDFTKDINAYDDYLLMIYSIDSNKLITKGSWTFTHGKDQLYFQLGGTNEQVYNSPHFNITKLTNNLIFLESPAGFININDTTISKVGCHMTLKMKRI